MLDIPSNVFAVTLDIAELVVWVIAFSASLALGLTPIALISKWSRGPEDSAPWLHTVAKTYATVVHDVSAMILRILIDHCFNRTTLIAFTVYIGAMMVASTDTSKVSACGAVIAMSLLWVVCDGCMRACTYGLLRFDKPLMHFMRQDINDIVRNIQNRRMALTASHE